MNLLRECLLKKKTALIFAVLLIAVHGLALGLQNISPKWLFSYVLQPENLEPATRISRLLVFAGIYLFTAVIFRMGSWHYSHQLAISVREHALAEIRTKVLRAATRGCAQFHERHPSGELHDFVVGSPIQNISQFLQHCTMALPAGVVNVVLTFSFFLSWDWVLALAMVLCCALSVATTVYFSRGLQQGDSRQQARVSEVSASIGDFLRGAKTLRFFRGASMYSEQVVSQTSAMSGGTIERELAGHKEYMRHESLGYGLYIILLAVCTTRYISHHVDLAVIAACLTAYAGLAWPIHSIISTAILWPRASAALQALDRLLRFSCTVPEAPFPQRQSPDAGLLLQLEHVAFAYPGASRNAIDGISLRVPFGQYVTIVGRSGGGKSTLAALILRTHDVTTGRILLGGADLRNIPLETVQAKLAIVPQDNHFFRCSLRTNLCIGNPDATEEELWAACAAACATSFIEKLPGKLDCSLGEDGYQLSGGERQRLAIARALLAEPDILILDEATSALDGATEASVLDNLFQISRRRTILFITHRMQAASRGDRIVVIEQGVILKDDLQKAHSLQRETRGSSDDVVVFADERKPDLIL